MILLMLVPVLTWCRGQGVGSNAEIGKGGKPAAGLVPEGPFWVTTPKDSLLAEAILADLKAALRASDSEKTGGKRPEGRQEDEGLDGNGVEGSSSVAELMVRAGKALEGQPYVAGTLDEKPAGRASGKTAGMSPQEKTVTFTNDNAKSTEKEQGGMEEAWREEVRIYLTRTDCIIFVETCLALARTAVQDGDFQMFANEIRQSRYRDGRVSAYADRLHYTTEWGMQGVERGVLRDVTEELGGVPLDRKINYMTAHPGSYPLMDDIDAIRKAEDRINSAPGYFIPKSKVAGALRGIRTGDIICLVTTVEGLDVSHVVMAVVEDGAVRMLHASTGAMKVTVDPKTLQEYLAGRNSVSGIRILRPIDCQ